MNRNWKTSLIKITVWLTAEIFLNVVGLDNLADYSEFVFDQPVTSATSIVAPQTSML